LLLAACGNKDGFPKADAEQQGKDNTESQDGQQQSSQKQ
jgi:hypothetical protein